MLDVGHAIDNGFGSLTTFYVKEIELLVVHSKHVNCVKMQHLLD